MFNIFPFGRNFVLFAFLRKHKMKTLLHEASKDTAKWVRFDFLNILLPDLCKPGRDLFSVEIVLWLSEFFDL